MKTLGQIAYDAFFDAQFGGLPKLEWDQLDEHARAAWEAAAKAVKDAVYKFIGGERPESPE